MQAASISGFLAVALGAFGAHSLKARGVSSENMAVWKTANEYHFTHTLAIMAVSTWARHNKSVVPQGRANLAIKCFAVGMVLFSGSLYALVLTENRKLGMITPIGGLVFLVGWGSLFAAAAAAGGGDFTSA